MNFEIIGMGFDGGTDATDDRIIWVSAPSFGELEEMLGDAPLLALEAMPEHSHNDLDVDFILPAGIEQLKAKLWRFTK